MIYTKMLGMMVGIVTIVFSIGIGLLSFIGMSIGKALNSQMEYSSLQPTLTLLALFLSAGLMTLIGAFKVKNKSWRRFYIGFCFLLSVGFLLAFLASWGALGNRIEWFMLILGVVYLGLGYVAKREKSK